MFLGMIVLVVFIVVARWLYLVGRGRGHRLRTTRGLPTHWGQLHHFEVVDRMMGDASILLVNSGGLKLVIYASDCPALVEAAPGTTWRVCQEDGTRRVVPTTRS